MECHRQSHLSRQTRARPNIELAAHLMPAQALDRFDELAKGLLSMRPFDRLAERGEWVYSCKTIKSVAERDSDATHGDIKLEREETTKCRGPRIQGAKHIPRGSDF